MKNVLILSTSTETFSVNFLNNSPSIFLYLSCICSNNLYKYVHEYLNNIQTVIFLTPEKLF